MENPSIMSHVSIGTNNFEKATVFYDAIMKVIGGQRIMELPSVVAYGKQFPEFWVHPPHDEKKATVGNGTHFSFLAESPEVVDAFYKTAIEMGATDDGPPGPRPDYGEPYYGCFVRDLDGHKIEANSWDMELAKKLGMAG